MHAVRNASIALSCALLALGAGLWLGGHPESLPDPLRDAFVDDEPALQAELIDAIDDSFYKPVEEDNLRERSLKGIVRSLGDRFSQYLTPEEAQEFEQGLKGEFEGVGLSVEEDRRGLRVLSVFERSPAERAGIKKGELIVAVDGRSIAGLSSEVATARIKGRPGTRVRLEVLAPGTEKRRELTLRRARIELPVAEGRTERHAGRRLGVVRLLSFTSSGAHGVLRKEVSDVRRAGAEGIVLDLRGNGGGQLQEAVLVASVFIEDGAIVSTRGRTKPKREFEAEGDAISDRVPLVVLVDGGSASASEIVTGALRDRRRATVVGTRTFGKGLFQEVKSLSNGGVLSLTVGSYFLPSGESISNKGIRPSVRARDNPRTERDEALPVALEVLAGKLR